MAILTSQISASSEAFQTNRKEMLALLDDVRVVERKIVALSDARRPQFEKRGQLHPRDRVEMLIDRGSPFVELSTLAGHEMFGDNGDSSAFGGATITGIGLISGVRCMVVAHDSGIKGGAITPMGMRKQLRAQTIAMENKLPVVYMVESAGGSMPHQADTFVEGGGMFRNQARMSAAGIPQISIVHGSSTAGGAYLPGLSDYVIVVRDRAKIFLAGPPLLKAATGEIATDEELGGAVMHTSISGVADYIAENDEDAIELGRQIIRNLNWATAVAEMHYQPPRYDPDELAGIVPVDFRKGYDVREVIARLIDSSDFLEFKRDIGIATVCGQGHLMGMPVAIVGNNGPIDADGATKAAQFIQLMCQSGIPIVYLQNITGYMVGVDAERRGIVKHGAKMIQAVANATVPQITLHIGASFGAGNYGMCGRSLEPRFIFAWPNNRVAVMGGPQAARVMTIIAEDRARREGFEPDREKLQRAEHRIVEQFKKESTALFATARLWDDGIIDPRDSRRVLGFCLATCREAANRPLNANTFGVARL
ncbi:MAG: acyl-CoA carboxylase subunit beta [Xanthobacteraceae bacterium]